MNEDKRRTTPRGWWIAAAVLLMIACGDPDMIGDAMVEAGTLLRDAGARDAQAQEPTTCSQWAVAVFDASAECDGGPSISAGGCTVPAGWEPYGAPANRDLSGGLHVRRCITP